MDNLLEIYSRLDAMKYRLDLAINKLEKIAFTQDVSVCLESTKNDLIVTKLLIKNLIKEGNK